MEESTYLCPITKRSTFQFPWSVEQTNSPVHPVSESEKQDYQPEPIVPPEYQSSNCNENRSTAGKAFSKDRDAGNVAMQLLRDSWSLFKDLRLEHWVEHVLGMPSAAISLFESYHHRLGFSLFCFLCQVPEELEKYHGVAKKVLPTDRFLCDTITHALKSFENNQIYSPLSLDTSPITSPLKAFLSQPDKNILRRLAVLANRYKRYRRCSDLAQGREFQTNTAFLEILREKTVPRIAWEISGDTFVDFRKISLHSIQDYDLHIRRLALRWDNLYYDVEDVAATGEFDGTLMGLAKEFYHLRNFFSLSAVLAGMSEAGIEIHPALAEFVDATENYRRYRLKLHMEPSLPFLYPFIRELRRGNERALRGIFSFVHYGQHLQHLEKKG